MAMKYYTEIVPFELAKKLKETGYPQELFTDFAYSDNGELTEWIGRSTLTAPTYAEVFDWLIWQGLSVEMTKVKSLYSIHWVSRIEGIPQRERRRKTKLSFHEAANAAIENACEILQGDV